MKRLFTIMILFFSGITAGFAQPEPGQGEERIKALYVAYISQELKLTEEEAQKFWPVHAQYDGEIRQVKLDLPELERQQLVLNTKKKYQDRFARIIGNERTNEFFKKDAEFRKKLVERLRKMRQNPGRRPGGNRAFR